MRAQIFPGQGSQQAGMGRDLYEGGPRMRRAVDEAAELTGVDLKGPLLDGPLDGTVVTQLGVFLVSVVLAEHLAERGHRPDAVAGHSLGEFSALVAGGWLTREAGLVAVAARARLMDRACAASDGAMSAVIGLAREDVAGLCAAVPGAVVANLNSPTQTVVSGDRAAVTEVGALALAKGAADVVALDVAGAFHSPLMASAAHAFAEVVDGLPLRRGTVPLVSSVTAGRIGDVRACREALARQITEPVRWEAAVRALRGLGCTSFLEVGPGRVLRGLVRRVDRSLTADSCSGLPDLRRLDDPAGPPART